MIADTVNASETASANSSDKPNATGIRLSNTERPLRYFRLTNPIYATSASVTPNIANAPIDNSPTHPERSALSSPSKCTGSVVGRYALAAANIKIGKAANAIAGLSHLRILVLYSAILRAADISALTLSSLVKYVISTPSASHIASRYSRSGNALPVSHLERFLSDVKILSASRRWVNPLRLRSSAIFLPIAYDGFSFRSCRSSCAEQHRIDLVRHFRYDYITASYVVQYDAALLSVE